MRFLFTLFFFFLAQVCNAQCNPTFLNSCASGNYIDSVFILGKPINSSSVCTGSLPNNLTVYNDTACWLRGTTYWSLVQTSAPNMHVAIYADLNGDNIYNNTAELVLYQFSTSTSHSNSLTIPNTAAIGTHKLRIITSTDSIQGPCDTLLNGECEEYYFSVSELNPYPINCSCPTSFNTISDTACITWHSPGGNQHWTYSGVFDDTLVNSNGCDSFLRIYVTVNQINMSIAHQNGGLQTYATGKNYQWYDCNTNQIIIGADSSFYLPLPLSSNNVACIISDSNCTDTSDCIQLIISATNNYISQQISIYPNPASSETVIKSLHAIDKIRLYNMQGQTIFEEKIKPQKTKTISTNRFPNGFYFIKVTTPQGVGWKKLLIEH